MAEPTATARLEVRNAAPSALGCQVLSMIRTENNAPASGTAYTAPSPAPAAQASKISRSRLDSRFSHPVAKSPSAAANWRGAPSRPSDAPEPTNSTCSMASMLQDSRGIGSWRAMVPASGGTSARRRRIHQPSAASAAPTIGPNTRRTGLLPVTPASRVPKL